MKQSTIHRIKTMLLCLAMLYSARMSIACQLTYTEYAQFGTFGPSYGHEVTDMYGDWSGTWNLSNYGIPAWWKENEEGDVVDSKTISECDTRWKVEENDVVILDLATEGTIQFTLHVHLGVEDRNEYYTRLRASHSLKHMDYFDNFDVTHIELW